MRAGEIGGGGVNRVACHAGCEMVQMRVFGVDWRVLGVAAVIIERGQGE